MAKQGTDGARGTYIPSMEITEGDGVLSLGDAAAFSMALTESLGPDPLVLIGRDTRPSGEAMTRAVVAGVVAAGGEVRDLAVAPTPTTLWNVQEELRDGREVVGGISITPSHNPHDDAGWKGTYGPDKPTGEQIKEIDERFKSIVAKGTLDKLDLAAYDPEKHLRASLVGKYMDAVVGDVQAMFDNELPLDGKLVVVDTARGAANEVTPVILERLGAEVVRSACDTKGLINHDCGATHLKSGLQQFLLARPGLLHDPRLVGAVANDGDADRVMGVGVDFEHGSPVFHVLDGNIGLELLASGQPGVVGTDYTNDATVERIRSSGVEFDFCRNGDVNVTRALQQKGWLHGAEFSGHIVLREWLSSGDGPHMAAIYLATAALGGTTFAEICREKPLYPELMMSVKLPKGATFNTAWIEEVLERTPEDATHHFRHVTRASGTEPLVRIWGVGAKEYVEERVQGIAKAVSASVGLAVAV